MLPKGFELREDVLAGNIKTLQKAKKTLNNLRESSNDNSPPPATDRQKTTKKRKRSAKRRKKSKARKPRSVKKKKKKSSKVTECAQDILINTIKEEMKTFDKEKLAELENVKSSILKAKLEIGEATAANQKLNRDTRLQKEVLKRKLKDQKAILRRINALNAKKGEKLKKLKSLVKGLREKVSAAEGEERELGEEMGRLKSAKDQSEELELLCDDLLEKGKQKATYEQSFYKLELASSQNERLVEKVSSRRKILNDLRSRLSKLKAENHEVRKSDKFTSF